jgi:hypothetical protein
MSMYGNKGFAILRHISFYGENVPIPSTRQHQRRATRKSVKSTGHKRSLHVGIACASDQGSQHASTGDPQEIGDHTAACEVGLLEELVPPVRALAPCVHSIGNFIFCV